MNCNNKQIFLHFYGYTWEEYSFQLPSMKGIYVVYGGKLSCEGEIELHNVLYIGFHESISEMFDRGVFENIRRQSSPYDRFFLAYAEFNDIANRFYLKNGFVLEREFVTAEGRRMNEYRYGAV